ncbi:MAG: anti-sigma factor antagonist [Planctomycetes bacterium]|nr:anti-sigma factor antagonist [Planctomycetota bacterium]MBL7043181.1 anti-sigma factor antagonist [Pirellulaceae bacterium]
MSIPTDTLETPSYHCPACGATVSIEPPSSPRHDAPCGCSLWCRKRMVDDVIVLDVLRGRTPGHDDVELLSQSVVNCSGVPHVVIDLSNLDFVNGSFMDGLMALYTRVKAANGRLILCGIRKPSVRDAFYDSSLDKIFDIRDSQEAALACL